MLYLAALLIGLAVWLIMLCYFPQLALQKNGLHICIVISLVLLFFAAMYEVQVGLIISLNEAMARFANY